MKKNLLLAMALILSTQQNSSAQAWAALGPGVGTSNNRVNAMTSFNGAIYAAGNFISLDGTPTNGIAKWDGTHWTALGPGINGTVNSLAVYNGELYAGGTFFYFSNSILFKYILKWNGSNWQPVGTGVDGKIRALIVYNGELYAGGEMSGAIVKWNGTNWSTPGPGLQGFWGGLPIVNVLAINNGMLYVGGDGIAAAGSVTVDNIAKWDGTTWSAMAPTQGFGGNNVFFGLAIHDQQMYAATYGGVYKWTNNSWDWFAFSDPVYSVASYNGKLYAGGDFNMGGLSPHFLAKWDSTSWSQVGDGLDNGVYSMLIHNGDLYVGGVFAFAGNQLVNHIARWIDTCVGPPPQPAIITGDQLPCVNSSYTYYISTLANASGYTWTIPAGWTGSSTINSITVAVGNNGGNLYVTANNPCGVSVSQVLPLSVNHIPPQPGLIAGVDTVCQGSSQTYSFAPVVGATSYNWTLPQGWTGSSNTNSITIIPGALGNMISVTSNNNCGSSNAQNFPITLNYIPPQPLSINGNDLAAVGQTSVYSVVPIISPINGASSYNWSVSAGGTITSGQGTDSIRVNWQTGGDYTITVTAVNHCGSGIAQTKSVSVYNVTDVRNMERTTGFTVYPNPSANSFYLKLNGPTGEKIRIEIMNSSGQTVYHSEYRTNSNNSVHEIRLEKIKPGIYLARIIIGKIDYTTSLVKTE